jgi:hypothetical protein
VGGGFPERMGGRICKHKTHTQTLAHAHTHIDTVHTHTHTHTHKQTLRTRTHTHNHRQKQSGSCGAYKVARKGLDSGGDPGVDAATVGDLGASRRPGDMMATRAARDGLCNRNRTPKHKSSESNDQHTHTHACCIHEGGPCGQHRGESKGPQPGGRIPTGHGVFVISTLTLQDSNTHLIPPCKACHTTRCGRLWRLGLPLLLLLHKLRRLRGRLLVRPLQLLGGHGGPGLQPPDFLQLPPHNGAQSRTRAGKNIQSIKDKSEKCIPEHRRPDGR